MKLNGSVLVAVAMMVGAVAMGCKSRDHGNSDNGETTATTPEETPDTAPTTTEAAAAPAPGTPAVEKDAVNFHVWSSVAPPAVRVEERGVAPHPGYLWAPGYYGWNGRAHTWYGGRWYAPRAGYEYMGPSWHSYRGRWGYRPGRWYRR
jgi:hypothetical protein